MKVALLLSGLPRKVNEGYELSWKHIIDNYDTDVYLHAWKDEEWETISETYPNAKSIQIQEPFKFTKYKEGISLPHFDRSRPLPQYDVMSCFRQLPMFYSWQTVYKPMFDSMVEYDVVIRSRYDLKFIKSIDLANLDVTKLNHNDSFTFFDDNICITNKQNADVMFFNIFDELILHSKEVGVLNSAEASWTKLLELKNMKDIVHKTSLLHFELLRDNRVWWGDADGNIIE
jgi:hypothetical protein